MKYMKKGGVKRTSFKLPLFQIDRSTRNITGNIVTGHFVKSLTIPNRLLYSGTSTCNLVNGNFR